MSLFQTWAQYCVSPLIISIFMFSLSTPLQAGAATTNCFATTTGITFGLYVGLDKNVNGTINIRCNYINSPDPVYVLLGPSVFTPRIMNNGSTTLNYNIYTTSTLATIWADGTNGSQVVGPLTCTGASSPCIVATQTMYGQIPLGQGFLSTNFVSNVPFTIATNALGSAVVGSGNFNVTAESTPTCTISSNNVNLGTYTGSANLDGSGSLVISCSSASTYAVTLQPSNPGSNTTGAGLLKNGNNSLSYQLYRPATNSVNASCAYSTTWGFSNPFSLNVTSINTPLLYNICVRIPAGQNVMSGVYTDNVIATITF